MHVLSSKQQAWFAKYWPALLIVAAWLWLFWPMMSGQTVCGFRDSAYLYYPLFKWIDSVWAAGQIPLWNPYDQFGVPVVGDGSSSVFYPGKLIFWFRFLSYESRYGIYLAIHVLIAAASCYWFARRLGCKQSGATFAAVSYAFGGSVLFQVCNVIFLVGAAWLPAAIGCVWLMIVKKSFAWAISGGFFCALIVLGGDPQLVYNIGLIGLGTIFGDFLRKRRSSYRRGDYRLGALLKYTARQVSRMTLLVGTTTVLSAIQVLPAMEWTEQSERAKYRVPRNVYEVNSNDSIKGRGPTLDRYELRGIFGPPHANSHHEHVFQFSQAPWTIAELVVPNLSGKPFPINARWSNAIPGADRMWVASLYSGCLAAVFALLSFRLWGKRRRQVWLSRIGLFFAVGSFGWYGLGWLAGEFVDLSLLPIRIGPQVGGIYWLLTVCLPKYILFRYPAKLFVIAALTMCVLAGLSVGRLPRCRSRMLVMLSCGVVGCVIGLLVLPSLESSLQRFWETVPADPLVGPFAAENASHNLSHSLGHLSMALAAAGMLIAFVRRRRLLLGPALVLIATVDILVANHWMIAEIDATAFASIENPDENISFPWQFSYPPVWSTESSSNRLEEIVLWQQRMLFPKHHLSVPIRNEFSFSSIQRRTVAINRITKLLNFFSIYEGRDHAFLTRMRPFQPDGRWRANVIEQRNGYYKIETDTPVDSMLCIQNLFLPDWHARITTGEFGRSAEVDIHRWIYSLQAIEIPSGKCIVELSYRPQAFYRGAWISGIGWSILLLLTGYRWLGGNRNEKGVN